MSEILEVRPNVAIFPLSPANPARGTIRNVTYTFQKTDNTTIDSSGGVELYTARRTQRFMGTGVYTGDSSHVQENFTVHVGGHIVKPTTVEIFPVGVDDLGRVVISLPSGIPAGTPVVVISTIQENNATPKTKTLRNETVSITVNGTDWEILPHYDVIQTRFSVTESGTDITDQVILDGGQRDEFYTNGRVRLPNSVGSRSIQITYSYFEHTGETFFSIDSYNSEDVSYKDIPAYVSNLTDETYELRSCLDFRPVLGALGASHTIPKPGSRIDYDYEYYVPRYDIISATSNKELKVTEGVPAFRPVVPKVNDSHMPLYILRVSPYTMDKDDIGVRFIENKRYTMRDIGKLETRIENLEYYTKLSLLENKTATVMDDEKFRNGFLVDDFKNEDIAANHIEFRGIMVEDQEICRCLFDTDFYQTSRFAHGNDVFVTPDNILIPKYTEENAIFQNLITEFKNVNPFNVFSWVGRAVLTPSHDEWIDEQRLPDIINTIRTSEVPDGFVPGTTSNTASRVTGTTTSTTERNFVRTITTTQRVETTRTTTVRSIGERAELVGEVDAVVDTRVIPFMRARNVDVEVKGLMPGIRLYFFFDGEDITQFVFDKKTNVSTITTDNLGEIEAEFRLPGGRFRTGEHLFKISDHVNGDEQLEQTYALAIYSANGTLQILQRTITMHRIEFPITNVSRTVTNSTNRSRQTQNIPRPRVTWGGGDGGGDGGGGGADPLAQTFFVERDKYPDGVYISSLDLYFISKDESLPVWVEIRPTRNGYPASDVIYPFASKTVYPKDVYVNKPENLTGYATMRSDVKNIVEPEFIIGSRESVNYFKPTTFKFDTPIYLPPGEHSFIVLANCNTYNLGVAHLGEYIRNTETRVTDNPYIGVFFESQNASTWSADQYVNLAFALNFADFPVGDKLPISFYADTTNEEEYHTNRFECGQFSVDTTEVNYTMSTLPIDDSVIVTSNIQTGVMNTFPTPRLVRPEMDDLAAHVIMRNHTNRVAPALDIETAHFVTHYNYVNNSIENEELPFEGKAEFAYVHRKVTLDEDFFADTVRIYVDAEMPPTSNMHVYMKIMNTERNTEVKFDDMLWQKIPLHKVRGKEWEFRVEVPTAFNVYQTKVVVTSANRSRPPHLNNFRIITFQGVNEWDNNPWVE